MSTTTEEQRHQERIPTIFDRLRAESGLATLTDDVLRKVCSALEETRIQSFGDLLDVVKSDDQMDDLSYNIQQMGVKRPELACFKGWLRGEAQRAPRDPDTVPFHNMGETLNETDASEMESTSVLRVDILSSNGTDDLPEFNMRIPFGAVDRQLQASSSDSVPVISVLGPTGTGKSFLTNSFLSRSIPKGQRPMVAAADQNVPATANVCAHRGQVHPDKGYGPGRRIVLLDFEGEDGRTPKTLIDMSLQHLARVGHNINNDGILKHLETTAMRRSKIIKQVLPPFAYLISDVIIFIDTVEPRRTERVERIREFAESAHKCVESMSWRPALIIVQNKWIPSEGSRKKFDITNEYDWICSEVQFFFSKVRVIRIPPLSHPWFVDGMCGLHDVVEASIQGVQTNRGELSSEREFWFNFRSMVAQFSRQGLSKGLENLDNITARNRISRHPTDNVLKLMELLYGQVPDTNSVFREGVNAALGLYAYSFATEARCKSSKDDTEKSLAQKYEDILKSCSGAEPCTATLRLGDQMYECKQRRDGHCDGVHRNPSMIPQRIDNTLLRIVTFGMWKNKAPCIWRGHMERNASVQYMRQNEFKDMFNDFMRMENGAFETSFPTPEMKPSWSRVQDHSFCFLCLRGETDLLNLPECKHPFCRECVLKRKILSNNEDKVICPICHKPSYLHSSKPDPNGLRILTLDGGGVRGLIEVMVLKKLEERFDPLSTRELFDIIVGTSSGGIVALALLAGKTLEDVEELLKTVASDILDVPILTKAWRMLFNGSLCDSNALDEAFRSLFGKELRTNQLRTDDPPYMLCTSYNSLLQETALMGSYPHGFGLSTNFIVMNCFLWEAAKATSAAPPFFSPWSSRRLSSPPTGMLESYTIVDFFDGGIMANCPAKMAVRFAKEHQACNSMGDVVPMPIDMIASLGTGAAEPSILETQGTGMTFGKLVVNFALDSERLWREDILKDENLKDVPRIRVNPPKLGSLDAFKSSSIRAIEDGMIDFFGSAQGKSKMNHLYHLTFAKLWQIQLVANPVAGKEASFQIALRDRVCDFGRMQEDRLRSIILGRSEGEVAGLEEMDVGSLRKLAVERFRDKPLLDPLPGDFVFAIDSEEPQPVESERSIRILFETRHAGTRKLEVFWRSQDHGDLPISGVPRFIEVLVNRQDGEQELEGSE